MGHRLQVSGHHGFRLRETTELPALTRALFIQAQQEMDAFNRDMVYDNSVEKAYPMTYKL
jgi:hypothetical protein